MLRTLLSGAVLLWTTALSAQSGSFLDVGGVKLWYEVCGTPIPDRPGLVLLHDGLVHSVTWDAVWQTLCSKYHVVRYDRRGYGRSDATKARFVPEDDLLKVMQAAHLSRAILIGNSSGGGLALDFALAHPDLVDGLFIIGGVVHGMASSEYFTDRGSKNSAPLDKGDDKAAAEDWSKDRFLIAGDDPAARKKLLDALLAYPRNLKVSGALEIRPDPPTVQRLSQIRVPTLALVGDADIADVFAYAGAIEAAVPLSTFEVWKDTGHLIQIQRPEQLVARIDRFYALATRKETSVSDATMEKFVGPYTCFDLPSKLSLREHHLIFEVAGGPAYTLFAEPNDRFFLRTEATEVEFAKSSEGRPTEMIVHNSDGSTFHCPAGSPKQ